MIFLVVNTLFYAAATGNHRGNQRVFLEQRKRFRPDQVNAVSSQSCRLAALTLQVQFGAVKHPRAHGLFDASFASLSPGDRGPHTQNGEGSEASDNGEKMATR